jgi:multidrug resistance efflux pump
MALPTTNLGSLAVTRDAPVSRELRLSRRWWSRVFIPVTLLIGFSGLALWASWDLVAPPLAVRVVPVRVQTGAIVVVGQELFKANGWVEPLPRPIDVPVQTEGMYRVKEVLVNPGDAVTGGNALILLDDAGARLNVEAAEKRHAKRLAASKAAHADVQKSEVAVTNAKAAIKLARAECDADANTTAAEVAKAVAAVRTAELNVEVEAELWRTKAVTSDVRLRQSRQALDAAKAEKVSAEARHDKAVTMGAVRVKQAELAIAASIAERSRLVAKAEEADQEAADAGVEVRKAQLELDRASVVAPVSGIVMALNVRPGSVVGGKDSLPEFKGALVSLYDPKKLQIRVEVPVARFALVRQGGLAEVEVEDVLPGRKFPGIVLYDSHLANVSRNSVPVRVELTGDPPTQLRPEMIGSVRFLAPPSSGKPKTEMARRFVIPRRLLVTGSDEPRVWIVDPMKSRAELRTVELAPGEKDRTGETVELVGGLNPTDKLIATGREQLKPGSRIKVVGEDR